MAMPGDDDDNDDEKATVRCLDVARYIVAATVTVLVAAVIVCAATGALRPPDAAIWVVGGSVWVSRNDSTKPFNASLYGDKLTFAYAIRAQNPSGSVRIDFTDVLAKIRAKNSSGDENGILVFRQPDLTLPPQKTVDTTLRLTTSVKFPFQEEYFKALGDGRDIDAWLEFNATRIVENYPGHNMTAEAVAYNCSPVVVAGRVDDDGMYNGLTAQLDALCT